MAQHPRYHVFVGLYTYMYANYNNLNIRQYMTIIYYIKKRQDPLVTEQTKRPTQVLTYIIYNITS